MGSGISVQEEMVARVSTLPTAKQQELYEHMQPLVLAAEQEQSEQSAAAAAAAAASASAAAAAASEQAEQAAATPPPSTFVPQLLEINITLHSAQNLRATDGRRGRGDPYVLVEVLDGNTSVDQVSSSTIRNNHRSPSWNETLRIIEPQGTQVRLQVWDQDTARGQRPNGGRDDLLGELVFETNAFPTGRNTHEVQGRRAQGSIVLTFETTMSSPPPSAPAPSTPSTPTLTPPPVPAVVTRREIREMPRNDQIRICNAFVEMMNNGEYFRLAGYHGWPNGKIDNHIHSHN